MVLAAFGTASAPELSPLQRPLADNLPPALRSVRVSICQTGSVTLPPLLAIIWNAPRLASPKTSSSAATSSPGNRSGRASASIEATSLRRDSGITSRPNRAVKVPIGCPGNASRQLK